MGRRLAACVLLIVGLAGTVGCTAEHASKETFELIPARNHEAWDRFSRSTEFHVVNDKVLDWAVFPTDSGRAITRNELRVFALNASEEVLRRFRDHLVARDVDPEFLGAFDDAVRWRREFEARTIPEVVAVTEDFLAKGMQENHVHGQRYYYYVSTQLLGSLKQQGLAAKLDSLSTRLKELDRRYTQTIQANKSTKKTDGTFSFLHMRFKDGGRERKIAEVFLKALIFDYSETVIETYRRHMAELDWDAGFRALFEKILAWRDDQLASRPSDMYEVSLSYRAASEKAENKHLAEAYDSLAYQMLFLAAEAHYPPAEFEWARKHLDKNRSYAFGPLWELAMQGYRPAQADLANRYLEGRDIPKDPAKGYYWFMRARTNETAAGQGTNDTPRVAPAAREKAESWLAQGIVPRK